MGQGWSLPIGKHCRVDFSQLNPGLIPGLDFARNLALYRDEKSRIFRPGSCLCNPPSPPRNSGSAVLSEEGQCQSAGLVGDRQSLNAKLLLGLQGLKFRRLFGQVGVDKIADTFFGHVREFGDKV